MTKEFTIPGIELNEQEAIDVIESQLRLFFERNGVKTKDDQGEDTKEYKKLRLLYPWQMIIVRIKEKVASKSREIKNFEFFLCQLLEEYEREEEERKNS